MKTIILFLILFFAILISSSFGGYENKIITADYTILPAKSIYLQGNNIHTVMRNDGIMNFDKSNPPHFNGGFFFGPGSVIFSSGIWIGAKVVLPGNQKELRLAASFYGTHFSPGNIPVMGAVPPVSVCNDSAFSGYLVSVTDQSLVNGGVRTKIAGGRTYTFVYTSWAAWPVNQGAPYVEVNGLPGYQPGWNSDRPGNGVNSSRPEDLMFSVYMNYTNCANEPHDVELSLPGGSLPLGVEIQQVTYAYRLPGLLNSYFVTFKFINKSLLNWDSTFITLVNDGDIGEGNDDAVGCDSSKNLAYTYNYDNIDNIYGQAPPAVGYKLVQGPVTYTGHNTDTAKFPCYDKTGYRMQKMTGHNRFINGGNECTGDPDNFVNAYNFMKGKNGCGVDMINPVTGNLTKYVYNRSSCIENANWFDSLEGDKRNLVNTGPFNMASGDTQIVTYIYSAERGNSNLTSICQLIDNLERAANYYYDCSGTIGIEPIGNILPQKYSLEQNYPNPFNPETAIKFSIPEKNFTSLRVYDILGKEIAVLVNEELSAGNYIINYNASDLPSGVYFYRLSTDKYTDSKKMIVIK
ncbi:MAG: T9SS type A sorting domain-containing protein [Ignavibacteria bacterium]|nr:T9SS type A sorting domain-containing protein [Ignavibacteria bacterium]